VYGFLNSRQSTGLLIAGDKPFEFTAAMHSYLEVQDIALAKVQGLKGLDFLDKVNLSSLAPPSMYAWC